MNSSNGINKEQLKSKDIFKNLKNDYFLIKLFDMLLTKKSLDIIKYNKNIKDRIKININNYKEYSGLYSSIELEIKTVTNKNGKFINISEKNGKYFHIYFNNNKEEIKGQNFNKKKKLKIIKIIIDYQIDSFEELFRNCEYIESINFKKFSRKNITNMSGMFYNCSSLKELNLSNFNTNNVINMGCMFS